MMKPTGENNRMAKEQKIYERKKANQKKGKKHD